MSQEQDKVFFRNYSIVIGILAVFLIICGILANLVVPTDEAQQARRDAITKKNTAPVGETRMEGDEPVEAVAEEVAEAAAAEPAVAEAGSAGALRDLVRAGFSAETLPRPLPSGHQPGC